MNAITLEVIAGYEMPAPSTAAEFLDVARKSNQIDITRLDAYLAEKGSKTLPSEPRKLAQQLIRERVLSLFQAEQFLLGKYKGFYLGGYRIIERIGAGGTGTVYLADHEVMNRRVALKVLPTPLAANKELLERFRQEARAASLLDHPNVLRVFDLRHEGRLHFIVMEYIDGPNLHQMVHRQGPLPVSLACEYARQTALGLHHAHERGLVHRDVKPANLLVDPTGTVKVLDLGLARLDNPGGDSVTQRFNNNLVLGTADYLAPEQALNLHEVDSRADIYSLGGTLYTLLTGRTPFNEGSIGQKLMWHQVKQPDPVTRYRPEVPADLAAIVARTLAKKPADRHATALEVAEALTPWAAQAPRPHVRPPSQIDICLSGRTNQLLGMPSGQMAPPTPAMDTVSRAEEDTGSILLEEPDRERLTPLESIPRLADRNEGLGFRLACFVGLVALMSGLAGGVIAFLLWGPRAG